MTVSVQIGGDTDVDEGIIEAIGTAVLVIGGPGTAIFATGLPVALA